MKRFLIIALSMMSSIALATPLLAESKVTINSKAVREIVEISPYDLVTGSYQGRFMDEGIPSAARFTSAVQAKKITAEDLIKVAIAKRRLSEDTLSDKSYLHSVRSILDSLDKN